MDKTEIELNCLDKESARPEGDPGNNNVENEDGNEVNRGNGNHLVSDTLEQRPFLPSLQGEAEGESNGGHITMDVESDTDTSDAQEHKPKVLKRLKKDLNKPVFGKIKLWMAILFFLVISISIILLLFFLCSGHEDDADDKYDRSSFVTSLYFRGSFRLANSSVVQDLLSQVDQNNDLFINLKQKLTRMYTSSPALERYFSLANIETMRPKNASVTYSLVFKVPEEHEQLKRYTLSREVVYHVLLQNLFDQDTEDQPYIEPSSLSMERVDDLPDF